MRFLAVYWMLKYVRAVSFLPWHSQVNTTMETHAGTEMGYFAEGLKLMQLRQRYIYILLDKQYRLPSGLHAGHRRAQWLCYLRVIIFRCVTIINCHSFVNLLLLIFHIVLWTLTHILIILLEAWRAALFMFTASVRERRGALLGPKARQGKSSKCFAVGCRGIRMKRTDFLCFFRVSGRGSVCLVLVSRSAKWDRGETSLGCGVRDRVDHRVDGGALRYRQNKRRCWQGKRRGNGWFHLKKRSQKH